MDTLLAYMLLVLSLWKTSTNILIHISICQFPWMNQKSAEQSLGDAFVPGYVLDGIETSVQPSLETQGQSSEGHESQNGSDLKRQHRTVILL